MMFFRDQRQAHPDPLRIFRNGESRSGPGPPAVAFFRIGRLVLLLVLSCHDHLAGSL
jgi:hypothetical protein